MVRKKLGESNSHKKLISNLLHLLVLRKNTTPSYKKIRKLLSFQVEISGIDTFPVKLTVATVEGWSMHLPA